ncbi:MAG: nucleotidyl transferase AbiEii/AbiGii toxin family protein [Synechococcus sp. SB0666_bin_14]|nr:nucleotidyl transferase AbiEii/AbiGii toxin family protein [Synechococcus sp. SB0666_bin_14]MYA90771.1 nucleotidyl transferase AbiEii/AbiGii toxin family protein [Synechococcus sp. SB0663_bin_10]MYG47243.1 nucleotidyl transferase AbiEii/AbiGii toxin family protein [Synechococcus sp. SB0675_bin_6]MYK91874.1 nucleotidyl transferase AbiEii/AbiGii toxin family protein [Synechococcus sp. SB0669_bin_8]
MISILDDDYRRILDLEVDQFGYSKFPSAILEKDLLMVKLLGLLEVFNWGECTAVFCGGTSLSKGYGLVERMSEDVDFKLQLPQGSSRSQARIRRRKLREGLAQYLRTAGFGMGEDPVVKNEGSYFYFPLSYQSRFPAIEVLRSEIKLEFIVRTPLLNTSKVEVRSLLFEYLGQEEAPIHFQAVDPQETLVEKVVAFLRRTATWQDNGWPRNRPLHPDDERLVRHLYDVHQSLQQPGVNTPETKIERKRLFQKIVEDDKKQPVRKDKLFQGNPIKRLGSSLE